MGILRDPELRRRAEALITELRQVSDADADLHGDLEAKYQRREEIEYFKADFLGSDRGS